jgi:hypothetical protein
VGGGDPAPGRSDRAFRTAATQMRRTDPAKLRYPAGRFAALGARGAGGGSGVVGGELSTAVSSRSSGFREWTTPIIAMTSTPMVPGRSSSARRTGRWPDSSFPCRRSPIMGRLADRRYSGQRDLGMAMADLPSGTVTFLSPSMPRWPSSQRSPSGIRCTGLIPPEATPHHCRFDARVLRRIPPLLLAPETGTG